MRTSAALEPVRRASAWNQRGGASWSSATSHSQRSSSRANSGSSGRFTCAWGVPLGHPQQARARREQRRVGREVAAVEEVPAEDSHYDARVTRHFLTGEELTGDELARCSTARWSSRRDRAGARARSRASVALVFEKPVHAHADLLRGRRAELGGHAVVLREGEMQLSRGESVRDTALVLSRYVARDRRAHRPARGCSRSWPSTRACPW